MPFLLAMIVALLLIIIFPQIALVLPNSMFG
jgi:TRAP-type C4-dicarboxylate transport system permease large subunit